VLEALQKEGVDSVSPSAAAGLYVAMAHLYFALGNTAELLKMAEEGARLADNAGDQRLLAEAENRRGVALTFTGRQNEAMVACERAARLAEAAGDLYTAAGALNNVAVAYRQLGQYRDAVPWSERSVEIAERLGDPGEIAFSRMALAYAYHVLGRWADARALAELAVEGIRSTRSSWYTVYPLASLGNICLSQGEREQGIAYLEEALALAARNEDLQGLFFLYGRAEQHILDGEPEVAIARLEPAAARWAANIAPDDSPILAWAYLETSNEERASEILQRAREQAEQRSDRSKLVEAATVSGMLATRQRRWEDAAGSFDDALGLAREMETPYVEARVLYAIGLMHNAKGEPSLASERLEQSLAICRDLGARQYEERCERALAALGRSGE
jgi:tetratricopeptide (TPR) repeat protein